MPEIPKEIVKVFTRHDTISLELKVCCIMGFIYTPYPQLYTDTLSYRLAKKEEGLEGVIYAHYILAGLAD